MNAHPPASRLRPFRPVPFGRYTLLAELARGGMGELYLARIDGPQGFEKLCVIKRILPHLAARPDFVARFINEAKTLVKLTHGAIAQVLDMGLHEGEPYLALELIDGKDLRKIAARMRDRRMPIPLTVVLHVFGRVLDALAYAHRKRDDDDRELQLVHRDVSPQNILVSYEGEVKVIDFGLAKSALSSGKTDPNIVLGKFLYMAPEQARHSGTADRRSDLYSVGLCLYELIHGENPFDGVPPGELMARVSQPQLPPLSEVEPLCPPAVAAMVTRALQPDPAQRFQTAEEFRARLQACLIDIDPSAGPESVSRFLREAFASDYQAERRLLASLREATRPAQQPLLPFKELSNARTVELVPPSGSEVTVPRAPLPLRDLDTRPRAPVPPRDDTDPRAYRDPDTDPRSDAARLEDPSRAASGRPEEDTHPRTDAARFEETSPGAAAPSRPEGDTDPRAEAPASDTQPRVILGTPLQETRPRIVLGTLLSEEPAAPRLPDAVRRRPESPIGLRRPVAVRRDQAPTIEWEPHPLPAERGGRLGWWVVAPLVLLTLGAVAYLLHDMYRSGAFLADSHAPAAPSTAATAPVVTTPAAPAAGAPETKGAAQDPEVELAAAGPPASTADEDALVLEPLTAPARPATPSQALLDTEWTRAREAFQALERRRPCNTESMATLCARFATLQAQVERSDGSDSHRLVPRIRTFFAAVEAKRAR